MDPLEQLLHGGAVSDEGTTEVISGGRNVTDGGLHVARDPLNKVGGVLVLDVQHLLVNILWKMEILNWLPLVTIS